MECKLVLINNRKSHNYELSIATKIGRAVLSAVAGLLVILLNGWVNCLHGVLD